MHLRSLLLTCFVLFSYLSFSQSEDTEEVKNHRFSIEPYLISGLINTHSDIDRFRFHVIPGLNIGMKISERSTLLVGANYSQLNDITYHIFCSGFFCPNGRDSKFINVSLGYKYDAFTRKNFSIEPFINIYEEITIYLLLYNSFENVKYEQLIADYTPYLGPHGVSVGTYFNYNISNHVEVFVTPTFSYLFARRSRYLIGSSFGTTITF